MKRLLILLTAVMFLLPVQAQALNTEELLSVIAMPLAVAAVSDVTGVPLNELSNFVATLNNANVPAPQVVELIRYVPVALVEDSTQQQPVFVEFVQTQVDQGVTGIALVPVIVERLRTYNVQPQIVTVTTTPQAAPVRTIIVDETFVPAVVRTRIEEIRTHPHGGPPGQLKKAAGVQTGAEIVHGTKPGKSVEVERRVHKQPRFDGGPAKQKGGKQETPKPMISSSPGKAMPPGQVKKMEQHGGQPGGKGHGKKH